MEPQTQADWYAGSGHFPLRLSAYELPAAKEVEATYPHFRVPVDQFLEAPDTRATQGPLLGNLVQVREIVLKAVEETIVKSRDAGEALDAAANEATEAIQDYNRRIGG